MRTQQFMAVDVGDSFQQTIDGIFGFIPELIAFLIILLVGYIIARIVKGIVSKLLQKTGADEKLKEADSSGYVEKVMPSGPSVAVAAVVFWLIFAFFLFTAIGALKIPALTTFMNQVLAFLPNILVAIVIFVLAAAVAGAIAGAIARMMGDTPTGKIAATVLPALIMVIALFMILEQLQIAPEIVRIAFAATMGALALGLALAFGLGGRSVAERMLESAYSAGQAQKDQVRSDIQSGKEKAQADAQSARDKMSQSDDTSGSSATTSAPDSSASGLPDSTQTQPMPPTDPYNPPREDPYGSR